MSLFAILATTPLFSFAQDDPKGPEPQVLVTRTIHLKWAGAEEITRKLRALFGDKSRVVFDAPSNSVYIQTTPARLRLAVAYARVLDENEERWPGVVCCISLQNIKATQAVIEVKALWKVLTLFGGEHGVWLVAGRNNTLIFSGTIRAEAEMKSLIRQLDVKPE